MWCVSSDMTEQGNRRIFIADDHPIVCQGVTSLVNSEEGFEVCGEAASAGEALERIRELRPDVVIVDLALRKSSGLDLIKDVSALYPDIKMVVLSIYDEMSYAERTLKAGAMGYVMKESAAEYLVTAIKTVLGGAVYLSDEAAKKIIKRLSGTAGGTVENLSDREMDVFLMTGRGISKQEIADTLGLSVKTVDTYREKIKLKLGIESSKDLLRTAVEYVQKHQNT